MNYFNYLNLFQIIRKPLFAYNMKDLWISKILSYGIALDISMVKFQVYLEGYSREQFDKKISLEIPPDVVLEFYSWVSMKVLSGFSFEKRYCGN